MKVLLLLLLTSLNDSGHSWRTSSLNDESLSLIHYSSMQSRRAVCAWNPELHRWYCSARLTCQRSLLLIIQWLTVTTMAFHRDYASELGQAFFTG